jgi:hypothetical protein
MLRQPRLARSNSGNSPIRLTPWEPYFINSLTYGPLIQMEDNYSQNGLDTVDKEDWKVVYDHIYEKARRIHESSATQAEKATKIANLWENERLWACSPAVKLLIEEASAEWVEQIKAKHLAGQDRYPTWLPEILLILERLRS